MYRKVQKSTGSLTPSFIEFIEEAKKYNDYEYPRVSVIVPVHNNVEKISMTLESILEQVYPGFEVIFVDAGSTDRTIEVIKNYRDDRIRLYSVSKFQRYEMLNKGVSQATGLYVNFLFPGDYYIHHHTLNHMMEVALDHRQPDLVYCGTLIRDGKHDPKILLRDFTLDLLKRGQQPTSLQSCWFRIDTLRKIGKFDSGYNLRGGFELMCRFRLNSNLKNAYTRRVLTDYDLRSISKQMVAKHFLETFKIVRKYFGLRSALKWIFLQKDLSRLMGIWIRSLRRAFVGR